MISASSFLTVGKKARLVLMFFFILNIIASQPAKIDSLEEKLNQLHDSRSRIEIYTLLSKHYQVQDLNKARNNAHAALLLSENTGIDDFKGEIFGCLGDIAVMQDSLDLAKSYYQQSLVLFEEAGDDAGLAGVYLVLGNISTVQNNLAEAIVFYQNALEFAKRAGLETWIDNLYSNIGSINMQAGNFEEAQELFVLALEKATEQNDSLVLANVYSNLGMTNINIRDLEQAKKYLDKSQEICMKLGASFEIAQNYTSFASLERSRGNYSKAIEYLRLAERYLEIEDPNYAGPKAVIRNKILLDYGLNHQLSGNRDSAFYFLRSAYSQSMLSGQLEIIAEASGELSTFFEQSGRIDSALHYQKIFKTYSDSMLNEENIKKVAYRDATMRFERKSLEEKQQREKEEIQERQNKTILIAIIIVLGLTLALLILLLKLNKTRVKRAELQQKSLQRELEIKNKELTTHVLYQLKRNEFILNIIKKLRSLVKNLLPENKKVIEGIIRELTMDSGEEVWKEFEVRFQQVHTGFYKNLVEAFPDLTQNELRLSAFLRLNMNTKDIAAITYQTTNSIDVARSRLRQKFGLTKEESLSAFLARY
jgi:tetratricopeptide (TPR) repeat protein